VCLNVVALFLSNSVLLSFGLLEAKLKGEKTEEETDGCRGNFLFVVLSTSASSIVGRNYLYLQINQKDRVSKSPLYLQQFFDADDNVGTANSFVGLSSTRPMATLSIDLAK
jgi:hypothetical protein